MHDRGASARRLRAATGWLVVDALFGAGLARPLDGVYAEAIGKLEAAGSRVVAVDLPSGVSGLSGAVLGSAPRAEVTVTFFRKKPGHLLHPGRAYCGEIIVADIGIRDDVLASIGRTLRRKQSGATGCRVLPSPANDTHKYARGHVGVFSGGPPRPGRRGLRRWPRRAPGQGRSPCCRRPTRLP